MERRILWRMASYPQHYSGGQGQQQQQPWQDGATDDEDRWRGKTNWSKGWFAFNLISVTVATASVTRRGVEKHTPLQNKNEEMQSRKATTPSRCALSWLSVNPVYNFASTEPGPNLPANRGLWAQSEQGGCFAEEHRLYPGAPWMPCVEKEWPNAFDF